MRWPAGEAIEFAKRAKDAGVDVTLRSLPEGQHNFILGAGRVPEVDKAIEEIGRWLRSKLGLAVLAAGLVPGYWPYCPQTTPQFKGEVHECLYAVQGDPVLPLACGGSRSTIHRSI